MTYSASTSPNTAPAYIVTVGDDRVIKLPESVPAGATVAVVVITPVSQTPEAGNEAVRKSRFEIALAAVREANEHGYGTSLPDNEEITRLVEEVRKRQRE